MQGCSEGAGTDALGGKRHSGNRVVPGRDAECKDLSTVGWQSASSILSKPIDFF